MINNIGTDDGTFQVLVLLQSLHKKKTSLYFVNVQLFDQKMYSVQNKYSHDNITPQSQT